MTPKLHHDTRNVLLPGRCAALYAQIALLDLWVNIELDAHETLIVRVWTLLSMLSLQYKIAQIHQKVIKDKNAKEVKQTR